MTGEIVGARARARRGRARPTRAPTSRARCASPTDALRGARPRRRSSSSPTARSARRPTPSGPVHLGDVEALATCRSASARRNVGDHAVLGAALPARQEPLRGDARGHQHRATSRGRRALAPRRRRSSSTSRSSACSPASGCRASTRTSRARAETLEAKIALADGTHDDLPADDHAYALLPERRRAQVLVVTRGQHVPRGGAPPRRVPRRHRRRARASTPQAHRGKGDCDAVIFDGVTPAEPPTRATRSTSIRAAPARPVKVERRARRSPASTRSTASTPPCASLALDDVNIAARAQARRRETGDKVVGAADEGRRSSSRARAAGTSSSRSASTCARAICRCASRGRSSSSTRINWFADEDAQLPLELPHRRRSGASRSSRGGRRRRRSSCPDGDDAAGPGARGARRLPRRAARASTSSSTGRRRRRRRPDDAFAANLLDAAESAIAPADDARRRRQAPRARVGGLPRRACGARSGSTCSSPRRS